MLSFGISVILLFVVQIDFFMAKMESVISLKTGDNAPEFNLKGIDDQMHSLNDYSKKGLLVIFMCNHCCLWSSSGSRSIHYHYEII